MKEIKRWLDEKEGQKVRKNRRGQKKGWNERMDSGNVRGVEAFVLRSKAVVSIKAEWGGRREFNQEIARNFQPIFLLQKLFMLGKWRKGIIPFGLISIYSLLCGISLKLVILKDFFRCTAAQYIGGMERQVNFEYFFCNICSSNINVCSYMWNMDENQNEKVFNKSKQIFSTQWSYLVLVNFVQPRKGDECKSFPLEAEFISRAAIFLEVR